ncbi:hypothetical protein PUNSTDRAFT_109039 [Punctularia strigosozonata HHB-11173 SS5]|uniref:BTB domain-containing protein n=1 Tax=Punctularia strigosozonata (strain HHB-11173) TaxID=741275 RepID=R7S279_PUNST|nr:uncharacterized protein PUNSTDRAFT_109039 [Punctularia strigosozonata HHB-11173 SS5]EIN03887.1 hypothetical protein PUNSTDRAFT_109039 [Punctularia strigosozonata HHB-11173 SS5]
MTSELEIVDADHPFNKPSADLILRTSDHVDFHVHKFILSEASPVFETMFSLPQPGEPCSSPSNRGQRSAEPIQDHKDGRPVVAVPEDVRTLDLLLRIIYPYENPDLDDLDWITPTLSAAIKYDMAGAVKLLSQQLSGHATTSPLRVYACAVRHGMEGRAREAAVGCLRFTLLDLDVVPELADISAVAHHRLVRFILRCQKEMATLTTDLTWIPVGCPVVGEFPSHKTLIWWYAKLNPPWTRCLFCHRQMDIITDNSRKHHNVCKWWMSFLDSVQAQLLKRPFGATILEGAFLEKPIQSMSDSCRTCRTASGIGALRAFAKYLAAEADRRIAAV